MYTGTIIKESLEKVSVLDTLVLTDRREAHLDAPALGQPPVWTLYKVHIEEKDVSETVEVLAGSLKNGPWYIDVNNGVRSFVIFPFKVFEYSKGDDAAKNKAQEYGRALGIPEKQLDWKS